MSITQAEPHAATLADEFLPVYDVSDAVALVVDAGVDATWQALLRADLIEVGRRKPLVGVLGALRMLPDLAAQILHGERPPAPPERMTLHDIAKIPLGEGGWTLLGERAGEEIALGLVGKFWRPVIEFAAVAVANFADFAEPGYAKTVYSLSVRALGDRRTSAVGRDADGHHRRARPSLVPALVDLRSWPGRARARQRAARGRARGRRGTDEELNGDGSRARRRGNNKHSGDRP